MTKTGPRDTPKLAAIKLEWWPRSDWNRWPPSLESANRPQVREAGAVAGQPALGGVALAILLLRPVLRCDEFRRQRQDPLVARCNDAGTEEGVEVFRAAIGTPPCRTLPAFDLARAVVLGPVERDQPPPVQTLERRQGARRLDRLEEQPVERGRRGAVQHQAEVVVGGDRRHPEQRLAVRSAAALRQPLPRVLARPLMRQERRASHEEDRKRRQADVRHRLIAVTPRPLAPVRQTGADLAQPCEHLRNGDHLAKESTIESRHKPKHSMQWSVGR